MDKARKIVDVAIRNLILSGISMFILSLFSVHIGIFGFLFVFAMMMGLSFGRSEI